MAAFFFLPAVLVGMSDVPLSGARRSVPRLDPDTGTPQTRAGLMRYRLVELQALARECRVVYTGVDKGALADRVAEYLSHPFTHRRTVVVTR